ncbi:MAG: hypothetical protein U9N58_07835, partial [Thermodesulfobacteriota bacterium]|nr:hypothetical protein [Thermodesulfobacteriota bacterium]
SSEWEGDHLAIEGFDLLPAQGYVLSLGHGEFQRITQGTNADNGYLHAGQDAHLCEPLAHLRVHPQGDDTADGIGL